MPRCFHVAALICSALLLGDAAAAATPEPAAVVQAFNQAVSKRDLAGAEKLLAKGSVQFTLRSAHAGVPGSPTGITSDLKTHWDTIGPVLFTVTSAYRRTPVILDSRVEGDLATVWTEVTTQTVERNGKERSDKFTEIYLLVKVGDAWLIGAIADNRGTDKLAVGQPGAPAPAP